MLEARIATETSLPVNKRKTTLLSYTLNYNVVKNKGLERIAFILALSTTQFS